jgi:hypothetical protein
MATLGEWMKMLHANRGKQIPLTILRNHKQQNLTLETAPKNHSRLVPGAFSFLYRHTPGANLDWINFQLR